MAEMSLKDGLKAMDVADYLRRHPQFLTDFPDLAMSLAVPREQGSAASLASYQLDVLRSKNLELEARLRELIDTATENEQLMVRVHSLTSALLRADTLAACATAIVDSLSEDFGTDTVRLLLLRDGHGLPEADWLLTEPGGAQALPAFAEFLSRKEPLVGRLAQDKLDFLFGEHAGDVHSAALMRLGDAGLLAIGSADGHRFHPGMGTVFLKLIAESAAVALARHADV